MTRTYSRATNFSRDVFIIVSRYRSNDCLNAFSENLWQSLPQRTHCFYAFRVRTIRSRLFDGAENCRQAHPSVVSRATLTTIRLDASGCEIGDTPSTYHLEKAKDSSRLEFIAQNVFPGELLSVTVGLHRQNAVFMTTQLALCNREHHTLTPCVRHIRRSNST